MGKRDAPGPAHRPTLWPTSIDGVVVAKAPFVRYDSGILTELYRPEWPGVFAGGEPVEHLYTVWSPDGEVRQEWYYHEHTLDRYSLLNGRLDVALFDGRDPSVTAGVTSVVLLGGLASDLPNQIQIPPGVWHSLRWHSGGGMFLNAKSPPFQAGEPDKFRIALAELGNHPAAEFLLHWSDGSP